MMNNPEDLEKEFERKLEEIRKIKKKKPKVLEDAEDVFEVDENSDIPVHEKYTKEKPVKK